MGTGPLDLLADEHDVLEELRRMQTERPVARTGQGIVEERPYSAWDLRHILARIPIRMSRARRVAAIAPVVLAAVSWFVIPSWAAGPGALTYRGLAYESAPALSAVACPPPAPVVSISGPAQIAPGATGTYTMTAQRGDATAGSPSSVTVTLPVGFSFGAPLPVGATDNGSSLTVTFTPSGPTQVQTIAVPIIAPGSPSTGDKIEVDHTASVVGDARCPDRTATSTSFLSVDVVAGAVAGVSTGPIGVAPSQAGVGGPSLHSPVTGINTGLARTLVIGLCLMLSGWIVITGIRRNPHAIAVFGHDI